MVEILHDGKVIHRSRNLRGLIAHARRAGVASASVIRNAGGADVHVTYSDGSECHTTFADFTVARDFFRKRWQRWGLFAEIRCSDDFWMFQ